MATTDPSPHLRDQASLSSSASSGYSQNRGSNMVRASVLDAVLQLGLGEPNSTVANWIFNNPLDEEDEVEAVPIPELTPSIATSEESQSNGYPYTLLGASAPLNPFYSHNSAVVPHQSISSSKSKTSSSMDHQSDITPSPSPVPIPFPNIAPSISASSDLKQSSGTKLKRKMKLSGNGYESDGFVSDGGKSKKDKERSRKALEAKAAKCAEKEARAAAKEAKKEEKVKKSKSKKEKKVKDKSKSIDGDVTEYETDAASDGAYLSEAVSVSSISSKKVKALSKSKSDIDSDSVKPKKTGSFFRRKSKPTPVVPPMPVTTFLLSASSSMPLPSGSNSRPGSAPVTKSDLPPIAAKFATTSAIPPISMSSVTSSVSSISLNPPSSQRSPLPSPSPSGKLNSPPATTSTPCPIPTSMGDPDAAADEGDDAQSVASSRSSEISMPTSLPTSTSASSHRKLGRTGLFKFGGSTENMKAKPSISLPLTRPIGATSSMPGRGVSSMSTKSSSVPIVGSGLESRKGGKPTLEVQTQGSVKSAIYREVSPVPSASSYMMAPMKSTTPIPSPLAQGLVDSSPSPNAAPAIKKSRPGFLTIQHPHEYNGLHTQDLSPLPSPRRAGHAPVPPPTPPPTGPLPRVPPLATNLKSGGTRGPFSAPPLLGLPPLPVPARAPSPLQRGREAPFPTVKKDAGPAKLNASEIGEEAFKYRGLYGFGGGFSGNGHGAGLGRQQQHISVFSADSDEEDEEFLDPDMLTNQFQQIRQRFYDHDRERASVPVTEPDRYNDSFASGGDDSFSYQQLNSISFSSDLEPGEEQVGDTAKRKYSDDRSVYPDDDKTAGRRTTYEIEGRDSLDARISRLSATQSVYSVMDDQKSGEARERFLSRVAALYGEGGREVLPVPPVPKLPEGIIIKGTGVGMRRRTGVQE